MRCNGDGRRRKRGKVCMEADVGRSDTITSDEIVHSVALLCPRADKKYAFESVRVSLEREWE